jgi:uncharacterized protein YxjI
MGIVGGARQIVTFPNLDGEKIELEIKGQWIDRHATIKLGDQLVAEVTRSFFNARQILTDNQTVCLSPYYFLARGGEGG